ncbi:MAG: hypothetical protein K0R03_2545 [Moraxellaceae bacterium]|jgi:hypothetical protein|nr:hypothetical protein [Moraxellaceae bacterium]
MPAEGLRFQAVQREMTDWLREPDRKPVPGVELRRLNIYRELFFNNVSDFVETAYPALKSLLPAEEWGRLLHDFFAGHRAQSPYFRDISLEFRNWMESCRGDWLAARPWAVELLHYEWVELAADCAETAPESPCQPEGDLLAGIPCLRQAVWPLVYRWPVHRLGPDNPPGDAPPAELTCLLVFRDDEDRVDLLEINPLSARLVELIQQQSLASGRELLLQLAAEAGHGEASDAFVQGGACLLHELRERGVIRGTRLDVV